MYFNIRSDDVKQCILVIVGVTELGKKEFIAIEELDSSNKCNVGVTGQSPLKKSLVLNMSHYNTEYGDIYRFSSACHI